MKQILQMKAFLPALFLLLVNQVEAQIDCITLTASGTEGTTGGPSVSVSATTYSEGNDVTVTVQGSYLNLLLQARDAYSGDPTPLGSFVNPTGGATLSSCSSPDDSVSVSSASADISATWVAPSTDAGDIVFFVTVIQSPDTVWTKLQSSVVISTNYHTGSMLFRVTFLRSWDSVYESLASSQARDLAVPLLNLMDNSVQALVSNYIGSKVILNRGDNIRSIVRMDFDKVMNLEEQTEIAMLISDALRNANWALSVQNIGSVSIKDPIDMFIPPDQTTLSVEVDDVCFLIEAMDSCPAGFICSIRTGLPVCECDLTQGSCDGIPDYGYIPGSGEDPMADKYGTCPLISIDCANSMTDCGWDYSCPDNQLCCEDGCGGKLCTTPDPIPSNVPVRLVQGTFTAGIVEVLYDGTWGMVCTSGWDQFDTNFFCSRLGYQAGYSVIPRIPQFQTTSTTVLMDNVQCSGKEFHLGQCHHQGWYKTGCTPDDTVALYCLEVSDGVAEAMVTDLQFNSLEPDDIPRHGSADISERAPPTAERYKEGFQTQVETFMANSPITATVEKPTLTNNGGFVQVNLRLGFSRMLNASEQLLAAYHLRDSLEANNWTLSIEGKVASVTDLIHDAQVSLVEKDICTVFTAKGTCINGGMCDVNNGMPYCKCPDDYGGMVCESSLQSSTPPLEPPVGDEHDVNLINGGCSWGFAYVTNDEYSGHICDTNWRDVNADVICRQAGYSAGKRIQMNTATLTSPVVMDKLTCDGGESGLHDCSHEEGTFACEEGHQVAVMCDIDQDEVLLVLTTDLDYQAGYEDLEQGIGYDLRLVVTDLMDTIHKDFPHFQESRLSKVSDDLGNTVLHVTLGFSHGLPWQENIDITLQSHKVMSQSNFVFQVDLVNATEITILNFHYESPVPVFCDSDTVLVTPSTDVCSIKDTLLLCANGGSCDANNATSCLCPEGFTGPLCERDREECAEGSHRCNQFCNNNIGSYECSCDSDYELASDGYGCNSVHVPITIEGGSCFAGRLTTKWEGKKGTVCDSAWDEADLTVACRQLGFDGPYDSFLADMILTSVPPSAILLTGFSCSEVASNLGKCGKSNWNITDGCSHSQDVGVICQDLTRTIMFTMHLDMEWQSFYMDLADDLTFTLMRELKSAISIIYESSSSFDTAEVISFSKDSTDKTNAQIQVSLTKALDEFEISEETRILVDYLTSNNFSVMLDTSGAVVVLDINIALGERCDGTKDVSILRESKCHILNYLGTCLGDSLCSVNSDGHPECLCPPGVSGKYCHIWNYRQIDVNLSNGGYAWGMITFTREGEEGLICGNAWNDKNTDIICNDLGFSGGRRLPMQRNTDISASFRIMDDLQCDGTEGDLGWCPYTLQDTCQGSDFVTLQCTDVFDFYKVVMQTNLTWQSSYGSRLSGGAADDLKASIIKELSALYGGSHNLKEIVLTSLEEVNGVTSLVTTFTFSQDLDVKEQSLSAFHLRDVIMSGGWNLALTDINKIVHISEIAAVFSNGHQSNTVSLKDASICGIYNEKQICEMKNSSCTTTNGPDCICRKGYRGNFCEEDIDECLENTRQCTSVGQECLNIPGSFSCSCASAYVGYTSEPFCEPVDIPARLGSGGHSWGRLEVNNNGQWGTVCDNEWTIDNSKVACHQLGFSNVFDIFPISGLLGSSDSTVWFDDIKCSGLENTLASCQHGRWGDVACNRDNDLGLICFYSQTNLMYEITLDLNWLPDYENLTIGSGAELAGGLTQKIGEMLANLPNFGSVNVLQLSGTNSGKTIARFGVEFLSALDDVQQTNISLYLVNEIRENGGVDVLSQSADVLDIALELPGADGILVPVSLMNENECVIFNTLQVCLPGSSCQVEDHLPVCRCPPGRGGKYCHQMSIPVRMSDGGHYYGRLEVQHHGNWGSVCESNFDVADADVACVQMGFAEGVELIFSASKTLPPTVSTALVSDFQCQGSEENLGLCNHGGWQDAECPDAHVALICSFRNDVIEFRFGFAMPFIKEYQNPNSPESVKLFQSLIPQIEALFNDTVPLLIIRGKNIVQDIENVFITIETNFQLPLTITQQSSYASLVASYITKEDDDITLFIEGLGEKEFFVHEVYIIIPLVEESPITALIYPEDPCAVFDALKLCEMGNSTCEVVENKAQCTCRPGYIEAPDGSTLLSEASGSTLSDVVTFCEAMVNMESPKNVTSDNQVVIEFKLDMVWSNIYANLSNPLTQGIKLDIETFLQDLYENNIFISNKTFASVQVLSLFAGSVGVVHVAEWSESLTPMEQEGITMSLLDFLMQDGRTLLIQGRHVSLVANELYIHYEGALPGSVDTIKVDGPCSVFDGRNLCMNDATCVAQDDAPTCLCSKNWTGQFCDQPVDQKDGNWNTILSSDSVGKNQFLVVAVSSVTSILVVISVTIITAICYIRLGKKRSSKRRDEGYDQRTGMGVVSRYSAWGMGWLPRVSRGPVYGGSSTASSSRMANTLAAVAQESEQHHFERSRHTHPPHVSATDWLKTNQDPDTAWPFQAQSAMRMTRGYGLSSSLFGPSQPMEYIEESERQYNNGMRSQSTSGQMPQGTSESVKEESDSTASWPYQATSPTGMARGFGFTSRQYRHSMGYY